MLRLSIVLSFLFCTYLNAQDWEVLLIEKEDTSLSGQRIIELDSGDLFLVTESFLFIPNSVDVFISGFPRYGLDLININQKHQIDTSIFIQLSSKLLIGNLLEFEESVIVPTEVYTGIESCYTPFGEAGSQATDLGLLKFDTDVSELLDDTLYLHRDTSVCGTLDFVHFTSCQDTLYSLRYNSKESKLLFELIDPQSLEILKAQYIDIDLGRHRAYFDCEDRAFLTPCDYDEAMILCKMDFDGNVLWHKGDFRGSLLEIEVTLEKEGYWMTTYDLVSTINTILYKLDKQGNIITNCAFEERYFLDIEPIGGGMLLALESGKNEIFIHIINEKGRIVSTDTFAYKRILAHSLKLLSTGEIVVVIDKLDAFDFGPDICCVEVGENSPNKVLVIKKSLKDIWSPEIAEKEAVIVFPNPTSSQIEILFKDYYFNSNDNCYFTLHSLNGEKLLEGKIYTPSQLVSLPSLPTAIYLVSVYRGDTIIKTEKIIVL